MTPLQRQYSFMEALLDRLTAPGENAEDVWSDLEAENEDNLEALTKAVTSLKKKIRKSRKAPVSEADVEEDKDQFDSEADFDEDGKEDMGGHSEDGADDGMDDEEDSDFDSEEDMDGLDDMDPQEQLRLLMQPCKDELDISDEDGEEDQSEDDEDDYQDEPCGKKVKFDILNANGDSDSDREDLPISAFEKQQARLRRSIAALESENIGDKDWTMRGEITATSRPTDSLLQEDLEFEHVAKLAPTITVDVTESLEDLIKKRIKDKAFDDVERVPEEILAEQQKQKAKRQIALDDEKSKMSLAEQYESDFQAAQQKKAKLSTDLKDDVNVDPATKAQHDEIRKLFGKLCQALDGLSENKFAPRTYELADAEIKTIKK